MRTGPGGCQSLWVLPEEEADCVGERLMQSRSFPRAGRQSCDSLWAHTELSRGSDWFSEEKPSAAVGCAQEIRGTSGTSFGT